MPLRRLNPAITIAAACFLASLPLSARISGPVSLSRYIVTAPPADVGTAIPLDQNVVLSFCADEDGCEVILQMINWDETNEPGQVANRTARLFLSQVNTKFWRLTGHDSETMVVPGQWALIEVSGVDDDDLTDRYWRAWDCFLTDAETPNPAGSNIVADNVPGFALLNWKNGLGEGTFDDATTSCRIVFID